MVPGCERRTDHGSRVAGHVVKVRSRDQLKDGKRSLGHGSERAGFSDADRQTGHGRLDVWLLDQTQPCTASAQRDATASTAGSAAARDRSSAGPGARDRLGARHAGPLEGSGDRRQQVPSVHHACERTQQTGLEGNLARQKPPMSNRRRAGLPAAAGSRRLTDWPSGRRSGRRGLLGQGLPDRRDLGDRLEQPQAAHPGSGEDLGGLRRAQTVARGPPRRPIVPQAGRAPEGGHRRAGLIPRQITETDVTIRSTGSVPIRKLVRAVRPCPAGTGRGRRWQAARWTPLDGAVRRLWVPEGGLMH
jgi:hypothetical protein